MTPSTPSDSDRLLLDRAIDGELTAAEQERLRRRLSEDPEFREEHRDHETVVRLLRELGQSTPVPSDDFMAERRSLIMAQTVERETAQAELSDARAGLLKAALSLVASIAIFAVAVWVGLRQPDGQVGATAPSSTTVLSTEAVDALVASDRELAVGMLALAPPGGLGRVDLALMIGEDF